ncbi:MAG: cation-transporting P-type ATPase, partial [Prosthecobacter sp.]|nr:cation-transporting P-type ATPase [Prosthecobacter sp.]
MSNASPNNAWHALSAADALKQTDADHHGLAAAEAARRLHAFGRNELTEGAALNPWKLLVGQFKSLIIWILIGAAVVTGVLGEWVDCVAIVVIVILNALIGFYQEFSAEKSIAALRKMTAPQARVRRDGHAVLIPAAEVVPGDVLEFEPGDLVAADARLLEASSLKCVEAALTGESDAVDKDAGFLLPATAALGDRTNMLFMGTAVAAGQGRAVVVGTGMNSELGAISQLLRNAAASEEQTPLQKRLAALGRSLVWACLGIVALLFLLGLLRGTALFEMFLTSVSLAVAAVPEGLPAVVTVALGL